MSKVHAGEVVKPPVLEINDSGKVRIGTATPMFPPVRVAPANVADREQVRIGTATPSFPPLHSR